MNYIPRIGSGNFRYDILGNPSYIDDNFLCLC